MKQELNLLDGYTPTNNLLNDAKQIIEVSQKAEYEAKMRNRRDAALWEILSTLMGCHKMNEMHW